MVDNVSDNEKAVQNEGEELVQNMVAINAIAEIYKQSVIDDKYTVIVYFAQSADYNGYDVSVSLADFINTEGRFRLIIMLLVLASLN